MIKYSSFIKREYDYAIRISAYLASILPGGHRSITDISNSLLLTKPITSKIVHKLKKNQILESVRGRNGGVKLTKNPKNLSFLDILTAMNFNSTLNECLKNPAICPLVSSCKIHIYFGNLEQNLLDTLENTFVSEFIISENSLKSKGGE